MIFAKLFFIALAVAALMSSVSMASEVTMRRYNKLNDFIAEKRARNEAKPQAADIKPRKREWRTLGDYQSAIGRRGLRVYTRVIKQQV